MKISKKASWITAAICLVAIAIAVYIFYTIPVKPYLKIGKAYIPVEIANDDAERIKGLSDRQSLAPERGMLFIFQEKAYKSFWMKDMAFPLDVIWIDGDRIIKIDKEAPPAGPEPEKKYPSGQPIDKVLEVNGGFADKHGIKVGDIVGFELGDTAMPSENK